MNIKKIRTRQEFKSMTNPKGKDYIIGMDIGYSATKVFYENGYFVFPSYAKRLNNSMLNISNNMDILYQEDGSDDIYMVGYTAQEMTDSFDTNNSDNELFARKRYKDKRFGIIYNTAMGIATLNKKDNREIVVQTGLPSSFIKEDEVDIVSALSKETKFRLKIGADDWRTFHIKVNKNNIHVIPQPMGSLYSALVKSDGKFTDDAKDILLDSVIVLDAGFGTFDYYGTSNREIKCKESSDELGMKQILSRAAQKIYEETNLDIKIGAMQRCLTKGTFEYMNEEEMTSEERAIAPYIEEANKEILAEAKQQIKTITNSFRGYKYVIIAGGTGKAWTEDIKEWLSKMKTLVFLDSNRNDNLPAIYSNVRGYYMYRYAHNARK